MAELVFVDPGMREISIECPSCAREDAHGAGVGAAASLVQGEIPLDRDWIELKCPREHVLRIVREGSEGARH